MDVVTTSSTWLKLYLICIANGLSSFYFLRYHRQSLCRLRNALFSQLHIIRLHYGAEFNTEMWCAVLTRFLPLFMAPKRVFIAVQLAPSSYPQMHHLSKVDADLQAARMKLQPINNTMMHLAAPERDIILRRAVGGERCSERMKLQDARHNKRDASIIPNIV